MFGGFLSTKPIRLGILYKNTDKRTSFGDKTHQQKTDMTVQSCRYCFYLCSFTSMGVNMGCPKSFTNRWHLIRNA